MRAGYECVCCGEICEDAAALRRHEHEQHGDQPHKEQAAAPE